MLIKLKVKQKLLIELKKTTHGLGPLCLKNCFWDTLNQIEVPLFFVKDLLAREDLGR